MGRRSHATAGWWAVEGARARRASPGSGVGGRLDLQRVEVDTFDLVERAVVPHRLERTIDRLPQLLALFAHGERGLHGLEQRVAIQHTARARAHHRLLTRVEADDEVSLLRAERVLQFRRRPVNGD